MTISQQELLEAYAAGETSPGLSLLCAAHLTLAPAGRGYVSALEELGGALLRDSPIEADETGSSTMSFDELLAEIDAEDAARPDPVATHGAGGALDAGPLPLPVARAVGRSFHSIPWKFRLPSISEHIISDANGEKISLMRARPGGRVPDHTHSGDEATLVLTGAMRDGERMLTSGDIALCGPEHDHHPEIIGDEICYCLIVVSGKLRFNGPIGRALNLFAE
ncbi:MAG: cupin domain-containing protein [Neomegalonema sp.]|nr:cupin domain-containing protein [Neomegalonema sp.]